MSLDTDRVKATAELNELADDVQRFDRDYQILKLEKYVAQSGILLAWANQKARGIERIKDLPAAERTVPMLLQMGKNYGY